MLDKLRNKILLFNMLVTSLVMLTAFGAVYLITYNSTQADIEHRLNSGALDFAPGFMLIVDSAGQIEEVKSSVDIPSTQYAEAASIALQQNNDSIITMAERTWRYKVAPLPIVYSRGSFPSLSAPSERFEILFLDITEMQNSLSNLALIFILVGAGMLAVIFVISLLYANYAIRPVAESWNKQKTFIADASHELKTPLTTIMTNCDVLEANQTKTIKSQAEWLSYIKIGADRMSKLVNNLLTLAKVEGMNSHTEKQVFDMTGLMADVMQSMEAAAAKKKLHIERNFEPVGSICGYEAGVRQVFTILYENAVKYADEGGYIKVGLQRTKKGVACVVKNSGEGISAKDLPAVFDRFYRADAARSTEEGSYGLGLSIAKSMAEQIGGKIAVTSKEHEWAEFVFSFDI